jgi:hypothetical protein
LKISPASAYRFHFWFSKGDFQRKHHPLGKSEMEAIIWQQFITPFAGKVIKGIFSQFNSKNGTGQYETHAKNPFDPAGFISGGICICTNSALIIAQGK